jgi:enoyl-CoA hydratase/carnithine racemase
VTTVTHEIDGKVGVVTLAKPPHNLIDDQLINDLVAPYDAAPVATTRVNQKNEG